MDKGKSTIKSITLSGSWHEMGIELGKNLRKEITTFNSNFFNNPINILKFGSQEKVIKYVRDTKTCIEQLQPHIWTFINGIAKGAELTAEEILLQLYLPELTHVNAPDLFPACTACGVSASCTLEGSSIIAQNWDFNFNLPDWYILKLLPPNGPEILTLAAGAIFSCCGINETGIGLTFTSSGHLPNIEIKKALPAVTILLDALTTDNYTDAQDLITAAPKAGAFNMLISDGYNRLAVVEAMPQRVEIIEDTLIIATNHYQHPAMVEHSNQNLFPEDPAGQEFAKSSINRAERLLGLLTGRKGRITIELIRQSLTDHANFPLSICAHEENTILKFRTLGSIIFIPAQQVAFFAPGQPCKEEYVRFSL